MILDVKNVKRKKRIEELIRSQSGALDKFFGRGPQVSAHNQYNDNTNVEDVNTNNPTVNDNDASNVNLDNSNVDNIDVNDANMNDTNIDEKDVNGTNIENTCVDGTSIDNLNADHSNLFDTNVDDAKIGIDIFDPRYWDGLSSDMIRVLVTNGPKRDHSIEKGPKDKFSRRFSAALYTRILPNKEKRDREWLVYSKELDKVFCFCCKVLRKGLAKGQLANEGFSDWAHLSTRLKEHEVSLEHITNMATWFDMRQRLKINETIDKVMQEQFEKERDHWKNVLERIISIVQFLAKQNLAFRGSNEKLYQNSNGNFLALIEMLEKFDPVIKEHVRRITSNEIHIHYLGHNIQNELILLLARAIKSQIINKIKQSKYYSLILDCTPDTSHQEQMSIILRYVNVSSTCVNIEESFLGFLNVDDTIGQGLFNVTLEELKSLDLDVDDMRGQGYDNGSNMKGKHQGVQKKFLDINSRAFYTPCGCHSLNLTLCDMANTCGKARDFFGIIQRIYTIFANSNKRWSILKENVQGLTLKSLSRVESVKAIRFQLLEIREALLQVAENDNDPKIKSEAKSLATNELGDFEFLLAVVIWYDILAIVNLVSKKLQTKNMLIDVAIIELKGLITFFEKFRDTGYSNAIEVAKKIAIEMEVDPVFPKRRVIRRKKHFDESSINQDSSFSAEESFRVNYFLYIVDQAIASLKTRFEQYQKYENIFGFLCLKSSCCHLEEALRNNEQSDIDANELYIELKLFNNLLPDKKMGPLDILKFLKQIDCFPNAIIAYRVLLTIPITVASAERSFSKLKLLKSYLRSTMAQERLNGLALIAIENNILESIDCEDLINNFASKNARRMSLFKG